MTQFLELQNFFKCNILTTPRENSQKMSKKSEKVAEIERDTPQWFEESCWLKI